MLEKLAIVTRTFTHFRVLCDGSAIILQSEVKYLLLKDYFLTTTACLFVYLLKQLMIFFSLQDNVFVHLMCTIQYRIVKENADDAYYELQNPQQQIQAYVFDGKLLTS